MSTPKFKNVHTMIGPDAKIRGPINLEQGIIVYGEVIGDVITRGAIRIAKDGKVISEAVKMTEKSKEKTKKEKIKE